MGLGLQINNGAGQSIIDTSSRTSILIGRLDISGSTPGATLTPYYSIVDSYYSVAKVGGTYTQLVVDPNSIPYGCSLWASIHVNFFTNIYGGIGADADFFINGNTINYRVYNSGSDITYLYYGAY